MSILADVMAGSVSEMAREMRDIDKRLVRVETVIEIGLAGRGPASAPQGPTLID